jgi:hypothetical protein
MASQTSLLSAQDKENTPPGRDPNILNLLKVFAANLDEKQLQFTQDIQNNPRFDLKAKIGKYMQDEMVRLLKEQMANSARIPAGYIELDYSTFKAKKIKQIDLIVTNNNQTKKSVKSSVNDRVFASPLTLVKPSKHDSSAKNLRIQCIDDVNRPPGWSLDIERPKDESNCLEKELGIREKENSTFFAPVAQPQNLWTPSKSKQKESSTSKGQIGVMMSGKKISKIRDESELTPQKLFGDLVVSIPKTDKIGHSNKKDSPARSKSPILDKFKEFFTSSYKYIMGAAESKEKKNTPDFPHTPPGDLIRSSQKINMDAKLSNLLKLPAISERLSERIAHDSKQPRYSEMLVEQKLAEEFEKQGNMDMPHLAMKRVSESLRYQQKKKSECSEDQLNKSMINFAANHEEDEIKQKRGSLSRTPFKQIKSLSMHEDTDSKAFYACLSDNPPPTDHALDIQRSESLPIQTSTTASSNPQEALNQNQATEDSSKAYNSSEPCGFASQILGLISEDTQQNRTQEGSLGASREEDTSQYVPNTAAKSYWEAAKILAQQHERDSSVGYEFSEDDNDDPDDGNGDQEEWRDPDFLSDCKTYSQQKHGRLLLEEIKKYCGPDYMNPSIQLNPDDCKVKQAYSAMNLSESQFMSLLDRQKTPIKSQTHKQKVLFINQQRIPQWAADKDLIRRSVLMQNAYGHYRAVFKKMKPLKEFNIAEFFPELNPKVLSNYQR